MTNRVLRLKWLSGIEFINFDTKKLPVVGSRITTHENWAGKTDPVVYYVECVAANVLERPNKFTLRYSASRNTHLQEYDDLWGETFLEIDFEKNKATAEWRTERKSKFSGWATSCSFIDGPLYAAIEREQISRIKRKQGRFREILLGRYKKCCLTLEAFQPVLEAAHIVDASLSGGYGVDNGLLMRADFHALFDKGIVNIDAAGKVTCDPSLPEKYRREVKVERLSHDVFEIVKDALTDREKLRKTRKKALKK